LCELVAAGEAQEDVAGAGDPALEPFGAALDGPRSRPGGANRARRRRVVCLQEVIQPLLARRQR
jgi:hypothetical protein